MFILLSFSGCAASEEEESEFASDVLVETATISRMTLQDHLESYGTVESEPATPDHSAGVAILSTPVGGIIKSILVTEGQRVEAGSSIITFDDRMAQAEVARSQSELDLAEQTVERERLLLAQGNSSQKRFEEAENQLALAKAGRMAADGLLAQVQLRTPISGVVSGIQFGPGNAVEPGVTIATIIDTDRLVLSAQIPATELTRVRVGQSAEIFASEKPERPVSSKVIFVRPAVDSETGNVLVRLSLAAHSGFFPGQFVRVRIVVSEHEGVLAVPLESVFIDGEGRSTLSLVEGDSAHQHVVQVGIVDGNMVEVSGEDLKEGGTVVTTGSYALPEHTKIRRQAPVPEVNE